MLYNLFIQTQNGNYNILGITEQELEKVTNAYKYGKPTFFLKGEKYWISDLFEIQIYTLEHEKYKTGEDVPRVCKQANLEENDFLTLSPWIPKKILERFGKRVTDNFIEDDFGSLKEVSETPTNPYVDPSRIEELKQIKSKDFDFTKLIEILIELNIAYANSMFLTIPLLIRAIIDHVPPIFKKTTFREVTGAHGSRSFQENMNNLDRSSRKIADSFLHTIIRNKETLPTEVQVNFKNNLDVLLMEIVRLMKI